MKAKKIFGGIFFATLLSFGIAQGIVAAQYFTDGTSPVTNLPPGLKFDPSKSLTSDNSGLNPGYMITPPPNTRPVDPNDPLPNVTATSAVVIEASTGHIIYSRNADQQMFPTSTTKMATLIMALESGKISEIVNISTNASGTEGSTLWLEPNEKIPLNDLLYGMIMVSANDASIAVAEHVDGSVQNFVEHMNQRAAELGATGTHFNNPHGLPDNNHYTTAHDLALLAVHGYTLPGFEEIVSAQEASFGWIHDKTKTLHTENQMLWLYRGSNGIKHGSTKNSGRCVISAAKRDGIQIIAVILDSLYMWNDSIYLLDYGFANVKPETLVSSVNVVKTLPVVSGRRKSMPVKTASDIVVPIFQNDSDAYQIEYDLPEFLTAPVKINETIGKAHVICDGKEIASTDIITTADVEHKSFFRWLVNKIHNFLA